MKFAIKHVLSGGIVAGYHACSSCSICLDIEHAKWYERDTPEKISEQVGKVRKNFEHTWNLENSDHGGGPEYRGNKAFRGCPLSDITTTFEIVPDYLLETRKGLGRKYRLTRVLH